VCVQSLQVVKSFHCLCGCIEQIIQIVNPIATVSCNGCDLTEEVAALTWQALQARLWSGFPRGRPDVLAMTLVKSIGGYANSETKDVTLIAQSVETFPQSWR